MPIIWRYILRSFFQVLTLCILGFIALLLITRFQDIARFASSGAPIKTVGLFALYQIPYILPLAIPISALISAILLLQRLSHTHELTAMRASGMSLRVLVSPLILSGMLLALFNFTICSEVSPRCRSLSKNLVYKMTASNPLLLLQKNAMIKLKGTFMDLDVLDEGSKARDVIFVMNNRSSGRLGLMTAKTLKVRNQELRGEQVSLISSVDPKKDETFDHLVIENQESMTTEAATLSQFLKETTWMTNSDYLPTRMLLAKKNLSLKSSRSYSKSVMEISKRFSLTLAALTFTALGASFGMQIGRHHSKKGIIWAICLSTLFIFFFVAAKSIKHQPLLCTTLYLLPHPIILFFSFRALRRVAAGAE